MTELPAAPVGLTIVPVTTSESKSRFAADEASFSGTPGAWCSRTALPKVVDCHVSCVMKASSLLPQFPAANHPGGCPWLASTEGTSPRSSDICRGVAPT